MGVDLYAASVLSLAPLDYRRFGELSGTSAADSSGHGNGAGTYETGTPAIQADLLHLPGSPSSSAIQSLIAPLIVTTPGAGTVV